MELALQAVDGTRIAANASMEHTHDAKGLRRLLARTEEAISELEAQNTTGGDPPAVRLPPELANAKALARVEHEEGPNQTNLTDEDAALLNTSKGNFITGYNAQSMVSPLSPQNQGPGGMLITAVDVTSSSDDHPQLVPMIEAAAENIGAQQDVVTVADAGYHSGANLAQCDARGHEVLMAETHGRKRRDPYHKDQFTYRPRTDTYLCPLRKVLTYKDTFTHGNGYRVRRYVANGQDCRTCPAFGKCTSSDFRRLRHFHTLVHIPRHLTHPSPNPTPPRTKTMRQPPLPVGRTPPEPVS